MAQDEEIIKKLVAKIAEEQNFVDYNLTIEPISSGGANYTSFLYNVTVEEGNNVHHLFAKVAIGGKVRSQAPMFYEKDFFVYTKLAKIFDRLQDEHQVPQEHRLTFSKLYGYKPDDFKETLVLQNFVKDGYEAYDRLKSIDWEYSKSALGELAKLHALSFAYDKQNSEEFNQIVKERTIDFYFQGADLAIYFDTMVNKAKDNLVNEHKEKFKKYFKNITISTFGEYYDWIRTPVLGHGDFRPSNLMHRTRDDGTVDIKIVDLQTLQGASPVIDLLYFIFTGSDEQFRAQYYDKLIDHYYTQLAAAMRRLHLDPEWFPREDFDYELKEKLPFGLAIAVFSLPVVTVAAEDAPKVNEDMDTTSFSVDKTSDLYIERLNGVVNDYVKWGVLK